MAHRGEATGESPLRDELAQPHADIGSLIGTVGRLADSVGDQLVKGARLAMSGAHEHAVPAFDSALAERRHSLRSTEETIQAHPFLSIAIAADTGMLLGKPIFSRG